MGEVNREESDAMSKAIYKPQAFNSQKYFYECRKATPRMQSLIKECGEAGHSHHAVTVVKGGRKMKR